MSRKFCFAAVLAVSMMNAACAQFEASSETLTPSAPSPLVGGSSAGPLVGMWTPEMGLAAPAPSTCANFQWEITSQSDTAVQGNFSAECGGGVTIAATVSGVLLDPTTVAISIAGTGFVSGLGCPFTLNGVGTIFDNNYAITIPYMGTTCFGPVSGTETVRRPRPAAPAPEPEPPPPPPGENPNHVGPGPLSEARAEQVVNATSNEFPHLVAPIGDVNQKIGNAEEMLLRCIWHLQLAGYTAARQRNPSGAISNDKLAVYLDDNSWHTYDIMTNFDIPGVETRMLWFHLGPWANPVPSGGIPD